MIAGGSHSIHCRNVSVAFDPSSWGVRGLDLEIPGGTIVALIGPSGCGKTTLLRSIAGLQKTTAGEVVFDPSSSGGGDVGFVFQQPSLLPWATTLENVMLPLDLIDRGTRDERRRAAAESLSAVQLERDLHKLPRELSGGMQMRASIARALVTDPAILLLDEPFAALDDMLRAELGELLLSLWERRKFTAVMVTHNIAESILLSHRIAIMRDGELERVIDNRLPWPRRWTQMREADFGEFFGTVSDQLRGSNVTRKEAGR